MDVDIKIVVIIVLVLILIWLYIGYRSCKITLDAIPLGISRVTRYDSKQIKSERIPRKKLIFSSDPNAKDS